MAFLNSVVDNRHYGYFVIDLLVSLAKWFLGSVSITKWLTMLMTYEHSVFYHVSCPFICCFFSFYILGPIKLFIMIEE